MQSNRSILCTAEVGNEALDMAAANGVEVTFTPFIRIQHADEEAVKKEINTLIGEKITAVFTSKNAVVPVVNVVKEDQVNWQVFCLGNKTQKAVKKLSGSECICVTESSEELARNIIQSGAKRVHFFCGDIRLDTLPDILKAAGVQVMEHIVYKTIERPHFSEKEYDGVLFFSPSGVRSFFSVNKVSERTALFAIGATTAAEVRKYMNVEVRISPVQSKEGVLTTAINYFKDKTI